MASSYCKKAFLRLISALKKSLLTNDNNRTGKDNPTHLGLQEFRQQLQQQMITTNSREYLKRDSSEINAIVFDGSVTKLRSLIHKRRPALLLKKLSLESTETHGSAAMLNNSSVPFLETDVKYYFLSSLIYV